jgi:hypothetical protein
MILLLILSGLTLVYTLKQYQSGVVFLGKCPECAKKAQAQAEASHDV